MFQSACRTNTGSNAEELTKIINGVIYFHFLNFILFKNPARTEAELIKMTLGFSGGKHLVTLQID